MEYKTIAGILTVLILTNLGTMYVIEDDGFKNCSGNWKFNKYTGQYDCESRGISEWCFKVSGDDPLEGYRCYLGKVTDNMEYVKIIGNNCEYICPLIDGELKSYTLCKCGNRETYAGELI